MTSPGTRWEYGHNIDFVRQGGEAERQASRRLSADHMLTPLGMSDKQDSRAGDPRERVWSQCMSAAKGGARATIPFELEQEPDSTGAAVYTAPRRLHQFTQMILTRARATGNQLIKPRTVGGADGAEQLGELSMGKMITVARPLTNEVDLYPDIGEKWGLVSDQHRQGRRKDRSPGQHPPGPASPNTYFWSTRAQSRGRDLMQLLPFATTTLEAFCGL